MKKYLFRDNHNGHYVTYQPFEISESITQEKANQLILQNNRIAFRVGSNIDDLLAPLDAMNIRVKKYNYIYYKPEDNPPEYGKLDPLPDCMYPWDVIEGITGNY